MIFGMSQIHFEMLIFGIAILLTIVFVVCIGVLLAIPDRGE